MADSFHHRLARRLIIGGLAIAATLGGGVLWLDLERIDQDFVAMGSAEAQRLSERLPTGLDNLDPAGRQAVDGELDRFIAERVRNTNGYFVVVELYDTARVMVADTVATDSTEVEKAVDISIHHFPKEGRTLTAKHLIGGHIYLQMVGPLTNAAGRQIGWFEGVYRIPTPILIQVLTRGLRATMLVLVAVAATSALLYPMLASLNAGLVARSRALLHANLGTLEALGSAIAKRDSDTADHSYRVTLYAIRLAQAVGLPPADMRALIKGAFLHDVGKIAIPDAVLLKPGKLDADEFTIMRTHVQHGLDIVGRFDWLADAAAVVGGHHEKVDGSGYPAGLRGDDIPIPARIFAIADVFDALTSRRPYKEPFPLEQALAMLDDGAGHHFDAALMRTFRTLAPALHHHLAGQDEAALQGELRGLTEIYFAGSE
ncbi:MAG: HD-GYP domain-containing protein [Magnetospirillum sp.]|nr:HD-GYP domain-containing protein [Magnetospirillum sp.]